MRHFLSFLIEKLWFTVLCIQMQSLDWKFGCEILQLLIWNHILRSKLMGFISTESYNCYEWVKNLKWLYRLLNFLLNSCCLNWKVYQFSFSFQNIMFQFSSPFILQVRFHSLRQIHEKIIVPQIARKDVFAFRPFTLHWQNSKSSFFGTWSTNSAHCKCKYAKKSQKNWIILHSLFLIF